MEKNSFANVHVMENVEKLLGTLTAKQLFKKVCSRAVADRVLGQSAQLSFYFFLSLFPLLVFVTALFGYFLEIRALLNEVIDYARTVAPMAATGLIEQTFVEITGTSSGGKITFGLIASLWVGSSGVLAIIKALNLAYNVKEFRPWWKRRLMAIVLTLVCMSAMMLVVFALVSGSSLIEQLADRLNLPSAVLLSWKVARWPVLLAFLFLVFNLLYTFCPNVRQRHWRWLTPGTLVGIGLWLAVSLGFKTYLQFFNRYTLTYGSIAAVIILLLWFYLTGLSILLGGEVNAAVEKSRDEIKQKN